jgi:predicted outer membrane repeat protein
VTLSVPSGFSTIGAAIDAAADGWMIEVGPGTYAEAVDLGSKAITIASIAGPTQTTIDGGGVVGSTVTVRQPSGDGIATIRGFTISGGNGGTVVEALTEVEGGGGLFLDRASVLLEDCLITGNAAEFGGGIYAYLGSLEIRGSAISSNQAMVHGGGIHLYETAAVIDGVLVESNSAASRGGGLYAVGGTPLVVDSEMVANDAGFAGGGVAWFAGSEPMRLEGVLLEANLASSSGDAAWIRPGYSNLILDGVVVCGSGVSPFSGQYTAAGPLVVDGLCVDCDGNGLTDAWELQQGIATDTDGDGIIDACECVGDLDLIGVVNGADLSSLIQAWGSSNAAADLSGDGLVDGVDLGILLLSWGPCL